MTIEINTHASASALAKLLGIDYKVAGEFKEFIEASGLETVQKTHIIKDKPIKYEAYDIMTALTYTYQNFGKSIDEIIPSEKVIQNKPLIINEDALHINLDLD